MGEGPKWSENFNPNICETFRPRVFLSVLNNMKMMIKREGGAGGSRGVQNGPKNFNPNFYETFRPRIFLPMDPLGGQGPRPRVRADGPLLLNPDPPPDVVILSRK